MVNKMIRRRFSGNFCGFISLAQKVFQLKPQKRNTMIRTLSITMIALFTLGSSWAQEQRFLDYIEKYKDIAIREMERAGIPASIKLAQGILESNAGKSYLAKKAKNHFGIKCGGNWKGKTVYREDDDYDDNGKLVKSCFRSYKSAEASYIAHSEFLRDPRKNRRYGFLFAIDPTDYKRWARGLKRAGYATSATYHKKLINLIEDYELHQYDQMSSVDEVASTNPSSGVLRTNDVKYVLAGSGESIADIAIRTDTKLRELLKYNEKIDDKGEQLAQGTKVYLQPKRNAYRGKKKYHVVQVADNMFKISQRYGIRLDKLYKRNKLENGVEPAVNEQVKLRGCKVKNAPKLRSLKEQEEKVNTPPVIVDKETGDLEMEEEIDFDEDEVVAPKEEPKKEEQPEEKPQEETKPVTEPVNTPKEDENKAKEEKTENKVESASDKDKTKEEPETPNKEEDFLEEPVFDEEPEVPVKEEVTPPVSAQFHTVAKGDTLWNISRRYNLTVDQLKQLNKLESNSIRVGMKLRVR